jgi:hypothetical protein
VVIMRRPFSPDQSREINHLVGGWRFGEGQLRLEVLELPHERVVRLVGDRRLIEDVVLVVRLLDPLAQLGGPLLRGRRGHAPILAQPPRS